MGSTRIRWRSGRRIAFAAAVSAAFSLAGGDVVAQTVSNVHVSSAAVLADAAVDLNSRPAVSDDGRYVAFASNATNLVLGDSNGEVDVFVRDRIGGTTVRVSVSSAGAEANGMSLRPSLSGDGRYVVFMSVATDLVAGDTNLMPDIFRHDRDADGDGIFDEPGQILTIRASLTFAGGEANGVCLSYGQAVSDDGDRIVFESDATNLVPGDTNLATDIFVRTVSTGITVRVSLSAVGIEPVYGTQNSAISGSGRWVVFNDGGGNNNLIPGDANNAADVYRVDLTGVEAPRRISRQPSGAQSDLSSFLASVSDDGNRIAYSSLATNLAGNDLLGFQDVLVYQVSDSTTRRVSQRLNGQAANGMSDDAWISGDGNLVLFASDATNLVPFDDNSALDIYAYDYLNNTLARVSRAVDGGPGDGFSRQASCSDDGTVVAFHSVAGDLDPADVNGFFDTYVRTEPLLGPAYFETPSDPAVEALSRNPVTVSVSGPVAEHTEGVLFPRGGPAFPQVPLMPMNPYAREIRLGPALQAAGIDTPIWPGDVADYSAPGFASEAELFESAPPFSPLASGTVPDGTINQVLTAAGIGLAAGPPLPPDLWGSVPPAAPLRDNVDAVSFGTDFFPLVMTTGFAMYDTLPLPPIAPGGDVAAMPTAWDMRFSLYAEPIVDVDGLGVVFQFSVDPWAVGAAGTAVSTEAGADVGPPGPGRWVSPGEAAGDIFESERLMRVAGSTVGTLTNRLLDDNNALGLRPDSLSWPAMEDDLDALESTGENVSWILGMTGPPGDLHRRVTEFGAPHPAPAGVSSHEANGFWPVFFSVSRNSPGLAFSGVRANFILDGGAGADIFVAAKNPGDPFGVGTNLLFIDNDELGLMPTDDLDALILWVCPEFRETVQSTIDALAASRDTMAAFMGALTGPGMTLSITKYLGVPLDCIRVGFSVTSESVGLEFTAVDWETGPVAPAGGVSAAAGDVFFARPDGSAINTNWLWHEEMDLGLDPGTYVISAFPGPFQPLDQMTDNLDGLDSADSLFAVLDPVTGVGPGGPLRLMLASPMPSPFRSATVITYALPSAGHVRLAVYDALGRRMATLADGWRSAGNHRVAWAGLDDRGAAVPGGLYLIRLESAGERRAVKTVRLR